MGKNMSEFEATRAQEFVRYKGARVQGHMGMRAQE